MAALVSRIFMRKAAVAPVQKIAVIEKKSLLQNTALSVGGGIVKTGAVVGTLGLVGAGAQNFKNSLFDGILDGSNSLGNLGSGLKEGLESAKTDIFTGILIIGGFIGTAYILKQVLK